MCTAIKGVFMVMVTVVMIMLSGALPVFSQSQTGESEEEKSVDGKKREAVYALYDSYKKKFPKVLAKTPEEVMALLKEEGPIVLVDARKKEEREVSMLPGAITQKQFINEMDRYKGHTVIAYCTIGYRSGKLVERLSEKKLQLFNLKGGILAWVLGGGSVYQKDRAVKKVHVYGKKWNMLPEGYEAVLF